MKVYLVEASSTGDPGFVDSVWLDKDKAQNCADVLSKKDQTYFSYVVTEYEVNDV